MCSHQTRSLGSKKIKITRNLEPTERVGWLQMSHCPPWGANSASQIHSLDLMGNFEAEERGERLGREGKRKEKKERKAIGEKIPR